MPQSLRSLLFTTYLCILIMYIYLFMYLFIYLIIYLFIYSLKRDSAIMRWWRLMNHELLIIVKCLLSSYQAEFVQISLLFF